MGAAKTCGVCHREKDASEFADGGSDERCPVGLAWAGHDDRAACWHEGYLRLSAALNRIIRDCPTCKGVGRVEIPVIGIARLTQSNAAYPGCAVAREALRPR